MRLKSENNSPKRNKTFGEDNKLNNSHIFSTSMFSRNNIIKSPSRKHTNHISAYSNINIKKKIMSNFKTNNPITYGNNSIKKKLFNAQDNRLFIDINPYNPEIGEDNDYNRFFYNLRRYNTLVSKNISIIENKLKSDIKKKKEKIERLSKDIEGYKTQKKDLQKIIANKNKKIEDLEKENKLKKDEIKIQKQLNEDLTKKEEELKIQLKELEEKYNGLKQKINEIQNNETKYKDKDFKNLEEISRGAYGALFSAYSIKDKKDICLKKIDINLMEHNYNNNSYPEKSCFKDLNNEIDILKLLSFHKNSVKYFGDYQIIKERTIIMEKCDEDLEYFMKKRNKSFNTEEIRKIFIDVNELFKIMHKNNIIHRDLKLKNFLIKYTNEQKTEFIVKLCDYGIGKFLEEKNNIFTGIKGSTETIAPEICLSKTKKYDNIIDIFSLGIIFYQLSHNLKHPFKDSEDDTNFFIKYYNYYDKDIYEIEFDPSIQNEDFKNLVVNMLKLNPKNRIKWEKYFEHPFFK